MDEERIRLAEDLENERKRSAVDRMRLYQIQQKYDSQQRHPL